MGVILSSQITKGNLLIVEDEEVLSQLLVDLLNGYADTIYRASNGLEALNIIKEQNIHCILSDINMPKMNGIELIKKLRSDKRDTIFIFFTGHGSGKTMTEVIPFGVFDFIDKPKLDDLENIVIRGLAAGTNKNISTNAEDKISDFKKLVQQLENK